MNKFIKHAEEMRRLLKRDEEAEEEIEAIVRNPRVFGGTFKVIKLLEQLNAIESEIVTATKEGWWLSIDEIEDYYERAKHEIWQERNGNKTVLEQLKDEVEL